MAKAATLKAQRREMIAAYAGARRRHDQSARLAGRLRALTCEILRNEMRAARAAKAATRSADTPAPAAPDLFSFTPA